MGPDHSFCRGSSPLPPLGPLRSSQLLPWTAQPPEWDWSHVRPQPRGQGSPRTAACFGDGPRPAQAACLLSAEALTNPDSTRASGTELSGRDQRTACRCP